MLANSDLQFEAEAEVAGQEMENDGSFSLP